jgi:predicted transcriptional regulator
MTGRKKSNLSRTLKTLERYGIVALEKDKNTGYPKSTGNRFSGGVWIW